MKRTHTSLSPLARRGVLSLLALMTCGPARAVDLEGERFDCLIEPKMTVMVGAATQGVISSIDVERSELVEKGQLLATLEAKVEKAALEQARMRARMKSEIQAREADLRLAQINMKRVEELYKKQMVPSQQRDEAVAQLQVAQMAVRQAEDTKRLYEHEFARAKEVLRQHTIRSPISGVVVEQRAFPGEFVYENPVMTIAQIDPLKVEAILPARFFGTVKRGMHASLAPEIEGSEDLNVKIKSIDRVIDAASGTFSVHFELPNPDKSIPGGQRCTLAFLSDFAGESLASVNGR